MTTRRIGGDVPIPSAADVALAGVAVACVQIEVWGFWVVSEQGPRTAAALFGLGMALALAWSRKHAFASLMVVLVLHAAWTLVSPPQGSLFPFLIELVAVFACGLRTTITPAAVGLGAAVVTEVLFVARTTNDFADYLFILVFLVAAWTAGRSVRARQKRADALFAETVRLEVEKEERARTAAEEERARIAREMHDIISHGVSVMVVQAAAAEQVLDQDPDAAREALRAIQDLGRDARTELRRMLGLMRPGAGDRAPQPGLDELPALLEQVRQTGLEVALRVSGTPVPLSPGVALTAYRVLQEGLTNAVAHGSGHRARVDLAYTDDAVAIEMVNDSEGATTHGGGHGLVGMAERLQLYGGSLHHERDSCGQFRLRARLPYSGDVR